MNPLQKKERNRKEIKVSKLPIPIGIMVSEVVCNKSRIPFEQILISYSKRCLEKTQLWLKKIWK